MRFRRVPAREQSVVSWFVRELRSLAANYRAACKGRSKAEFISKLGTVEEEADESAFWMELLVEGQLMSDAKVRALRNEAVELTAIMAASRITASRRPSIANRKLQIANP
jgi:four helix bundle protein